MDAGPPYNGPEHRGYPKGKDMSELKDRDILDLIGQPVFIADTETHELLYMNQAAMDFFHVKDYQGKTCHQAIHGLEQPCSFCNAAHLEAAKPLSGSQFNQRLQCTYQMQEQLVEYQGRKACLEIAFDVIEQKTRQDELESLHALQTEMVKLIQILNSEDSLDLRLQMMLARLGMVLEADKTHLFLMEEGGRSCRAAYEWRQEDTELAGPVESEESIPVIERWLDIMREHHAVLVPDIEPLRIGEPQEYETMSEFGLHSYIEAPVYEGDELKGFLAVDNPAPQKFEHLEEVMLTLAYSVSLVYQREETRRYLKDQAQNLQTAVRNIPAGIAVYRWREGKLSLEMANSRFYELLGMNEQKPTEDALLPYWDRVHPDDQETLKQGFVKLFSTEHHTMFFVRTLMPETGRYLWVRFSSRSVPDADGSMLAYALLTDASEQKKQEDDYDQKMRELTAMNPNTLAVFHMNLTRNTVSVERAAASIADLIGNVKTVDDLNSAMQTGMRIESDRVRCRRLVSRKNLLQLFEKGQTIVRCEYRIPADNSEVLSWATSYFNMVRNPRTEDIECVAFTQNTDREVTNRMIIGRVVDLEFDYFAIIRVKTGTVIFRNMKAERRSAEAPKPLYYDLDIRYAFGKLVGGRKAGQIADAITLDKVTEQLKNTDVFIFPYSLEENDGTIRRKQLKFSYMDESHDEILLTRQDITASFQNEQKQMKQLQEAFDIAKHANDAKTEFVSRISHDIRTPLNAISNMTQFAREDRNDPVKLENDLDKIQTSNTFLLSLINDILDISRLDSGEIELHPEPYPFEEYITNIRSMVEPMCSQKSLKFVVVRRQECGGCILADKIRINQIVLNLLTNAVKYTPAGGTVTYVSDSERLANCKMRFGFEVRDTGIGMSPEFQKKMFEPFTQEYENPRRPRTVSGTGLGLSIVHRVVQEMGGTISVRSAVGMGTTFRVDIIFPDAYCDSKYAQQIPSGTVVKEHTALSGRVLLAEDNRINAEIARRLLESYGLSVDWAKDGKEAVERFADSAVGGYALILMDLQMPLLDGYQAAGKIRSMRRLDAHEVPIYAMTADVFDAAIRKCTEAGMNGHIGKPVNSQELYQKLYQALHKD
jgi:signal transduction histidine kinase/PAS domain-containing protein